MMPITLSNVAIHFNAKAILTPAEKAQKKLLDKFGGFTKRTQQNSLKRGKPGPRGGKQRSKPGQPPLRHSSRPDIKNTVFYFVDLAAKDVVIGMVLLSGKPRGGRAMPGVLEHSGPASIKTGVRGKERTVNVEARPSSTPAFQKTIKKQLPGLIAGGIMREA